MPFLIMATANTAAAGNAVGEGTFRDIGRSARAERERARLPVAGAFDCIDNRMDGPSFDGATDPISLSLSLRRTTF